MSITPFIILLWGIGIINFYFFYKIDKKLDSIIEEMRELKKPSQDFDNNSIANIDNP